MINFSKIARSMRSSEIRRLMKLAADPKIISFSGGMPNNKLLPTEIIDTVYDSLTVAEKQAAMQYGPTSGYPPLLESLTTYLKAKGLSFDGNGLIVTTGAQQAINLVAKVMLDNDDQVLTENPSFIGALAAFNSYGAECIGVDLDNDGIDCVLLAKTLDASSRCLKMVYLIPNFQNPAGTTYTMERKRQVIEVLKGHDVVVLEDDPYGELAFDNVDTTPIQAMCGNSLKVCYTGSFAKICGPGLRLGWLLAPIEIVEKCELAKQSMDACSSTFTQVLAHKFLSGGYLPDYLVKVRKAYKYRAGIMHKALKQFMPDSIRWTHPCGGFYVWVTLPEGLDASDVFTRAIEKGAAIVIGSAFDPLGKQNNCFRLAFSHTPEDRIEQGIEIVANAIKGLM